MRFLRRSPSLALAAFLAAGFAAPLARAADAESRFSATLTAPDRAAAGLGKLTSDEVAVIDALVRRDSSARSGSIPSGGATFSLRLTADQRRLCGFNSLTNAEIAQLDAFVERLQTARLARTLLAPPALIARPQNITTTEKKTERAIHGSFSLSYGMGSGGYSEKSGSMNLTFEDPARGLTINVGYTETHVKGGRGAIFVPYALPPRPPTSLDPARP